MELYYIDGSELPFDNFDDAVKWSIKYANGVKPILKLDSIAIFRKGNDIYERRIIRGITSNYYDNFYIDTITNKKYSDYGVI